MTIQQNIQAIKKSIGNSVKIVAVTKNRNVSEILKAIQAGITDIGENRLQEAKNKLNLIPDNITKHFIGRMQTNKIKDIINIFDVIQSVDSIKITEKINTECMKVNKVMPIFVQINTSDESQKGGISPIETIEFFKKISNLTHVKAEGLMTIAINSNDKNKVKKCFKKLKNIFDKIKQKNIPNVNIKWISMGMSGDYELAIEEGANMIRIGNKIFS